MSSNTGDSYGSRFAGSELIMGNASKFQSAILQPEPVKNGRGTAILGGGHNSSFRRDALLNYALSVW